MFLIKLTAVALFEELTPERSELSRFPNSFKEIGSKC
jgi:hypothetical protein